MFLNVYADHNKQFWAEIKGYFQGVQISNSVYYCLLVLVLFLLLHSIFVNSNLLHFWFLYCCI